VTAPRVAGVIIAGGRSRRMGRDKLLLPVGGVPLIERVVGALADIVDELILALRPGQSQPHFQTALPLRTVRDPAPDLGPLGGLIAALSSGDAAHYLAVAGDMPLLQPPLLAHLLTEARCHDVQAVVPLNGGEPEPLCAVYRQDCLAAMSALAEEGGRSLRDLLAQLHVHFVPEDELRRFDRDLVSFLNVNHQADLHQAERLLATSK